MAKKFYWLRLKEDFFNDPDIKLIKSQADGKDFLILYLQLQLLSLRSEGILRHKDVIPYTPDMLSTLTDTPKSIVEQGIKLFVNLGMIEQWDDGTLYMLEMQKLIGNESESAARVRKHREQKKMLQCNDEVTKSNTEIEKEIEKEKELNNTSVDSSESETVCKYKDVFDHYMTLDLIKHRAYTKEMTKAIKKAEAELKCDTEHLKTLLDRHMLKVKISKGCDYETKPRPLVEFFGQKKYQSTQLICSEYDDPWDKPTKDLFMKSKPVQSGNKFQDFEQRSHSESDIMAKLKAKNKLMGGLQ